MSMKKELPVEFYIYSDKEYKSHKLNILKESLGQWSKPENIKFFPHNDFKFEVEETDEDGNASRFHCWTTIEWLAEFDLFYEISDLQNLE